MKGNDFLSKQNALAAYQDARIFGVILCPSCEGHGTLTQNDSESLCVDCNGTGRRQRLVEITVTDRPL